MAIGALVGDLQHRRSLATLHLVRLPHRLLGLSALLASLACKDTRAAIQQGTFAGAFNPSRDLIISRIMVNPAVVSDEVGEWIEIANLEADSADLRGWQLRSAHDPGFTITRSLVIPPGGTVILGRNADSASNGGVHVDLMYTGIVLGNSGDWLVLRDSAGMTADSVDWNVPPPGTAIDHRTDHKQHADSTEKRRPRRSP